MKESDWGKTISLETSEKLMEVLRDYLVEKGYSYDLGDNMHGLGLVETDPHRLLKIADHPEMKVLLICSSTESEKKLEMNSDGFEALVQKRIMDLCPVPEFGSDSSSSKQSPKQRRRSWVSAPKNMMGRDSNQMDNRPFQRWNR